VNRSLRRVRAMAKKEMLHMVRDVRVLFLAIGMPVMMLVLFGFGVSTDVDHVPLGVLDQDGTRASRRLIEGLLAGGAFERVADLASPDDAQPWFRAATSATFGAAASSARSSSSMAAMPARRR
jgi:ABC-2 type transport system permease protein